jgi:hypothetical protein
LDVNGTAGFAGDVTIYNGTGNSNDLLIGQSAAAGGGTNLASISLSAPDYTDIYFQEAGATRGYIGLYTHPSALRMHVYTMAASNIPIVLGANEQNTLTLYSTNNAVFSGNVGIGTSSPNYKTQIVNTSAGSIATQLFLQNSSQTDGTGARLDFSGFDDGLSATGSISNVRDGAGLYSLRFSSFGGGSNTERLRITSAGDVGIGTSAPTEKLEVNGNVKATGFIGNLSGCTVDGTNAVGFRTIPQNSQSAAYTLVLEDSGKHIFHPSADTTARTFTIPANSSVAFPIGTVVTFINQNAAGVITIAITTDTMRLSPAGTTGSRTLAANGSATAIKVTATEWLISGSGLT